MLGIKPANGRDKIATFMLYTVYHLEIGVIGRNENRHRFGEVDLGVSRSVQESKINTVQFPYNYRILIITPFAPPGAFITQPELLNLRHRRCPVTLIADRHARSLPQWDSILPHSRSPHQSTRLMTGTVAATKKWGSLSNDRSCAG